MSIPTPQVPNGLALVHWIDTSKLPPVSLMQLADHFAYQPLAFASTIKTPTGPSSQLLTIVEKVHGTTEHHKPLE
jgi:hypothetical protein